MKVFFDKRQTTKANTSFSPSAQKSGLLAEEWKRRKLPVSFVSFRPITKKELYSVHEREFVDGVLSCRHANGYGNTSRAVAKTLPWVCGSFVRAVQHSVMTGEDTWSLTSGAHHAHFHSGGAFCTFNFLMLGAVEAQALGAKRIVLLDFDRHEPDGCRNIVKHVRLNDFQIYSFGEQRISSVEQTEEWLTALRATLLNLLDGADLILYNAGVDPAVSDPLGGVMTDEQMERRDRFVFETAKMLGVPVVVSLAGGYSKDQRGGIGPTLMLHTQTLLQYFEAHTKNKKAVRDD